MNINFLLKNKKLPINRVLINWLLLLLFSINKNLAKEDFFLPGDKGLAKEKKNIFPRDKGLAREKEIDVLPRGRDLPLKG